MDNNIIPRSQLPAQPPIPAAQPAEQLDARQALALREWMRLAKSGQTPRRAAFRPDKITKALPVSTLVGVEWTDGQLSFRQRIEGKMVQTAFGESRGRSFNERFAPDHLAQSLPAFADAVRDGRVTLTSVSARTPGGARFDFTRLLLPFTDEQGRVVRVLAVYGFDTDRLINLRSPLRMTDELAGAGMQRAERAYLRLKTA